MAGYEILSRDPWIVKLGGVPHEARPVSAEALLRFRRVLREGHRDAQLQALERLLLLMFPLRLSNWWRGNPARKVLALPAAEARELLADFFASRGVAAQPPTRTPTRRTPTPSASG